MTSIDEIRTRLGLGPDPFLGQITLRNPSQSGLGFDVDVLLAGERIARVSSGGGATPHVWQTTREFRWRLERAARVALDLDGQAADALVSTMIERGSDSGLAAVDHWNAIFPGEEE
jgi:hypothetical protein